MAVAARGAGSAQRILDLAERLIQVRGYNGFSYADIAQVMQVTKASLHYHFPSKAELVRRLMLRYAQRFRAALDEIDGRSVGAIRKLQAYVALYAGVLADGRMCLCGMLAAEFATLPAAVRTEVTRFFDLNEAWLATVLEQGRRAGELAFTGQSREAARLLVASLEGAMMLARTYDDVARFQEAGHRLLSGFSGKGAAAPRRRSASGAVV
jgi:TetR/AcrR family transcriptional regulator, transcriptional repressor for nem operon